MFLAAKQTTDGKDNSHRTASKATRADNYTDHHKPCRVSGVRDALSPKADGVVQYRGRLVKFCWPHPKDDWWRAVKLTKGLTKQTIRDTRTKK